MAVELNTENREYITWQYEQLNFGLLGGLKIEGLERMRVTLKVEYKQVAVRHNLDLYNNESLDKLVRRCAEQEKVGESIPAEDVIQITSLSENAFYYFKKQELKYKLILIEDLDGAVKPKQFIYGRRVQYALEAALQKKRFMRITVIGVSWYLWIKARSKMKRSCIING
jgi:hypothetical protein